MKTYSLSHANYLKYRRRFMPLFGIIAVLLVGVLIIAVSSRSQFNWFCILPMTLFFLGVVGFSAYRAFKQQREVWESIRIVIGDDYIARQQLRIPEIRIAREEITALREINQGICVYTADKFRSLVIPTELERSDYEEIKNALAAWMSIQPKARNTNARNGALSIVLFIGFAIIFLSWSAWLVLIVGLGMMGYYVYIFSLLQRDKGVDPQFRRNTAITLGFLAFIFVMKLCVLLGWYESLLRTLAN